MRLRGHRQQGAERYRNGVLPVNLKATVLYGVGIWAVTFIVAFAIFPLRADERPLFESIMPVVLTGATLVATLRYLAGGELPAATWRHGFRIGLLWLAISLALDALMFSRGPMQMSLADYAKDIGVTYLIILIIPVGFGWFADSHPQQRP